MLMEWRVPTRTFLAPTILTIHIQLIEKLLCTYTYAEHEFAIHSPDFLGVHVLKIYQFFSTIYLFIQ